MDGLESGSRGVICCSARWPHEVRTRIERMFPRQKKIELFARVAYPGWDVWGNDQKIKGENPHDLLIVF